MYGHVYLHKHLQNYIRHKWISAHNNCGLTITPSIINTIERQLTFERRRLSEHSIRVGNAAHGAETTLTSWDQYQGASTNTGYPIVRVKRERFLPRKTRGTCRWPLLRKHNGERSDRERWERSKQEVGDGIQGSDEAHCPWSLPWKCRGFIQPWNASRESYQCYSLSYWCPIGVVELHYKRCRRSGTSS